SSSFRRRRWRGGWSFGRVLLAGGRALGPEVLSLGGDEAVEPGDLVFDGLRVVLAQGPQVAVDPVVVALARGARGGQLRGQAGPAPLEQLEAAGRGQGGAQGHLQWEGLVVAGRILEQGDEQLAAVLGDAVHLAGPPGPALAAGGRAASGEE